jgi:nitrate reductase gamma subunit
MTTDQLLYGVFPYLIVIVAIGGTIWRYTTNRYSFSSLSSQFLESRQLFWGSVPWHYGLLVVLGGHLVAFLVPRSILAWNAVPLRLYILELTALVFGLMMLVGLVMLMWRRATNPRIRVVSSWMDWLLLLAFLVQVVAGLWTAIFHRWGSSWFAGFITPYLWSLFTLNPRIDLVSNLPFAVQVHIIGGFAILGLLPFSRLVHLLSFPWSYATRPPQLVIWNRRRQREAPTPAPAPRAPQPLGAGERLRPGEAQATGAVGISADRITPGS